MRIPYSWLKEHIVWDGSPEDLAHKLTLAGIEVEEIHEWSDGDAEDLVFDTSVTANRGDLLSVAGVARHAAATLGAEQTPVEVDLPPTGPPAADDVAVEIVDPLGCPRYSAVLVRGVRVDESPRWMRERLLAAGMRPINNVVDCTNYVLWELGQPLHAFDANLLANDEQGRTKIIVRRAEAREEFISLDEGERTLEAGDVVIADPKGAVALAGVMGGLNSEVNEDTLDVLIESAHFDPVAIRKTSLRLGMSTEASYRFERVVDPEGTVRAAQRCAQLIVECAGGEVAEGSVDAYPGRKGPLQLELRPERANEIIGIEIPAETQGEYLAALGMTVTPGEGGRLQVIVPSFRPDIEREIDLIEEIAIVHGYESIPGSLPGALHDSGTYSERQRKRHRLRELLQAAGLCETINLAMIDPAALSRAGFPEDAPERNMLALQRATDEGQGALRTTLITGLLAAAELNAKQRVPDVALYEIDCVFLPTEEGESPREPLRLCALITGGSLRARWNTGGEVGAADFYLLKGILEEALDGMGVTGVEWEAGSHPTLRDGHCAEVLLGDRPIGHVGEVTTKVQEEYGLPRKVYMVELDADAILGAATLHRAYEHLPRFPAALRDLAVVLDDTDALSAAKLEAAMREAGGELLVHIEPFDVFVNPKRLGEGRRSIAFSLEFRSPERTLTDDEVNEAMERITSAVTEGLGAHIREA